MLLLVPSCSVLGREGADGASAEETAAVYLNAWAAGDAAAMAAVVIDPPADFASVQQQFRASLHVATAEVADIEVESSGDEATAAFAADLGLQGLGHWAYDGTVDLQRVDGTWGVAFTPASLH
ncbi:MAG TPA: NTF2-like N-terminal transpeptidase domain-containing protein, partial [Acidimicrobiales bacterium]|nr:NTF2-like N-terminal transpeptidase domain-containing protein [Acidimicrobiales bacterium]